MNTQPIELNLLVSENAVKPFTPSLRQKSFLAKKESAEVVLFLIRFTTELNNTRLYWLWIKYLMVAKIDASLGDVDQANDVLTILSPISDILSYGLYLSRLILIILYLVKSKTKTRSNYLYQALSDILWGLSNFFTVFYLPGSSIKALAFTAEWYGHISMQILLVYDMLIIGIQYASKTSPLDKSEDALVQFNHYYCKKNWLIQLSNATALSLGYFLFRGPFCCTIHLNPFIGSGICVTSTITINCIEWIHLEKKHRTVQSLQGIQKPGHQLKLLVLLPILLNLFFPLILLPSLKTDFLVLSISIGLISMTLLNLLVKQVTLLPKPPLSTVSFFKKTPIEIPTQDSEARIAVQSLGT